VTNTGVKVKVKILADHPNLLQRIRLFDRTKKGRGGLRLGQ
jgi:hypothetical protein